MKRSRTPRLARLLLAVCPLAVAPPASADGWLVRINGTGSGLDLMKPLLAAYAAAHPGTRVEMNPPLGSSGAMAALLAGDLDLAVLARPLRPEEEARGARATPYGKTPLVFVTHRDVPKESVTTAELEEIYAGRKTRWPDGTPIRVILRPEGDTDTKLVRSLSSGLQRADVQAHGQPWALVAVTDLESNELVAGTPGAIGAATLTSAIVEALPLRRLALDGVEGTREAVLAGRYPLAKDITFATVAGKSPAARALIEFACSVQGRAVAERSGVVVTAGAPGRP